jgi:hypothetical protein
VVAVPLGGGQVCTRILFISYTTGVNMAVALEEGESRRAFIHFSLFPIYAFPF